MQPAAKSAQDIQSAEQQAAHHMECMRRLSASQDVEAFQALYGYFGPRITGMMLKAGANREMAEDIAQDVMVAVWRKAPQYRAELGSVSAWVFTIARNARIDRLRRRSSQPYQDIDDIELESDLPDGEDQMQASEREALVSAALAELPDEQREVIELAYIEDISQSEIADRLKLPLGTVKSRMRLAYGKLKERLEVLQ